MSNNKTTQYLNRLVKQQTRKATRKATLLLQTPKKSPPCLICGNPVCRKHASQAFRKEGINLCGQCETLFGLDFVVDIMSAPSAKTRQQNTDRLMDVYDRALLLLKYSAQYIDEVANALEESTRTSNRVGLGSSSAGIVSGVLGIVSAATLFTPAGPPLLIASLLFGGSATAVQTGTEVRMHLSQPNQLADRILALHGICHSILKVVGALRDAVLRDHLRTDLYKDAPQKVMDYNSHAQTRTPARPTAATAANQSRHGRLHVGHARPRPRQCSWPPKRPAPKPPPPPSRPPAAAPAGSGGAVRPP